MQDEYFRSRNLSANVDFYSAPLLYSLGIPVDTFTCMFAMSRIVGWTAHVYEQQANNRLIRPLSNWMGEHQLPWVPMDAAQVIATGLSTDTRHEARGLQCLCVFGSVPRSSAAVSRSRAVPPGTAARRC